MNRLSIEKRAQIIRMLVEGMSMRAASRVADVSINTVTKLLIDIGQACSKYQDAAMRNLPCKRIQCDEIWSFCYSKKKNVSEENKGVLGHGDVYTWTAFDPDSKLIVSFLVGHRDYEYAKVFINDVASRLANRVQLTVDGRRPYLSAVDGTSSGEIDFAQLAKIYGPSPTIEQCLVMRRLNRLTNGISKKVENFEHAIALHFMLYNFGRVHKTLHVTPAMKAGIADHVWTTEEFVNRVL